MAAAGVGIEAVGGLRVEGAVGDDLQRPEPHLAVRRELIAGRKAPRDDGFEVAGIEPGSHVKGVQTAGHALRPGVEVRREVDIGDADDASAGRIGECRAQTGVRVGGR